MKLLGMSASFWTAFVLLLAVGLLPSYFGIGRQLRQLQVYEAPVRREARPEKVTMERSIAAKPRLVPDAVFEEWKRWHSVDALRSHPHNRTFIVAEYSCPRQAGNLIHDFLSALLQGVATNRTVLWRYQNNHWNRRDGENRQDECERILQRAAWLPSYDEWSAKLFLPEPYKMSVLFPERDRWTDVSGHQVLLPGSLRGAEKKFDVWRGLLNLDQIQTANYLSLSYNVNLRLDKRIPMLYSQGVAYLYGMLFWNCFTMTAEFLATIQADLDASRPYLRDAADPSAKETFTIGLHSRHVNSNDDGGDVFQETQCLDWLISTRRNARIPCVVFIMADRPATIENLSQYLKRKSNCAALSVSPDPTTNRTLAEAGEHGPFAGAGFFRDLALASQARSGFAGSQRSSSALLLEFMDYKRRSEAHDRHGGDNDTTTNTTSVLDPMHRCYFKVPPPLPCDDWLKKSSCLPGKNVAPAIKP